MASRYSITLNKASYEERFGVVATDDYKPRFNAAPSQLLPVIASFSAEGTSFFHWGQSPARAKNKTISDKLINANLEEMIEKTSFLRALKSKRCLIPADGFYIWKNVGKKRQIPYRVVLSSGEAFGIPGIWEEYDDEFDKLIYTFKTISVEANNIVGEVTNRMPAILDPKDEKAWLDPNTEETAILEILKNVRVEAMTKFTISPRINSVDIDDVSLIHPAPAADQFGNYSLFD